MLPTVHAMTLLLSTARRSTWLWRALAPLWATVALAPAFGWARDAEFDVVVTPGIMVAMRDGVRLATDVYLPARAAQPVADRLPTILTRTPYDKTGSDALGRYFAARGYVVVAQDTRGRYGSEGVWHMLTDD